MRIAQVPMRYSLISHRYAWSSMNNALISSRLIAFWLYFQGVCVCGLMMSDSASSFSSSHARHMWCPLHASRKKSFQAHSDFAGKCLFPSMPWPPDGCQAFIRAGECDQPMLETEMAELNAKELPHCGGPTPQPPQVTHHTINEDWLVDWLIDWLIDCSSGEVSDRWLD